jgi:hypothetical protein
MTTATPRNGLAPDRASDERVLRLVKWRVAGHSPNAIAARFGMSRARVAQLTDPVLADDVEHSTTTEPVQAQEPADVVTAAYWKTGSGRRYTHAG